MPNSSWVWSSIAEGPAAIYVSGYDPNGTSSSIFKITLDTATANSLGFPELNVPTVTIDLPAGERINGFDVYLGTYAVIATSKGVRGGVVSTTGDITYGPLLYDGAACYDVTSADRFAYVTTTVDGEAGLLKIDLSTTIGNTLVFPYAWDLIATGTSATSNQVSFFGNSDRLAFSTGNNIWAESTGEKVTSGYLQTGYIRFNTLEDKIFIELRFGRRTIYTFNKSLKPIYSYYGNLIVNPWTYSLDKFYIDSLVHDEATFDFILKQFGADRIAMGSDFPFPLGDLEHGKFIEDHAKLTLEEKQQLLYKTAKTWLGIE
jgi:hypothetical protein